MAVISFIAGSSLLTNMLQSRCSRLSTRAPRKHQHHGWCGAPRAEFHLRPLPYELEALEPHMSKKTLEFHWGKHHRGGVENLNKQIEDTLLVKKRKRRLRTLLHSATV
jgi:hypothetical protein